LAALSNDALGDFGPELTYHIKHRATVKLVELARAAGVRRFLFSSSCSNYGAAGDRMLLVDAPFSPVTPYGVSKVRPEQGLLAIATDALSPVLLRSAVVPPAAGELVRLALSPKSTIDRAVADVPRRLARGRPERPE